MLERVVDDKLTRFETLLQARLESSESTKAIRFHIDGHQTPESPSPMFLFSSSCGAQQLAATTHFPKSETQLTSSWNTTVSSEPGLLGSCCSCKPLLRNPHQYPGSAHQPRHNKGCALSFLNKEIRDIKGEIRVFNHLFRWKVSIQYSRSAFFRDLQVQPNFTARAVVASDSPSFGIMVRLMMGSHCCSSSQELQDSLSSALIELRLLFAERKAWPTDMDVFDRNLLHVS